MKKCQILIPFQGAVLTIEELGGISNDFVCFNPDRSEGKTDYKIQTTDAMLLKFEGSTDLVSVDDYDGEFIIINSKGEVIADSLNTNPYFVDRIIDDIIQNKGTGDTRKGLN